MYEQIGTIKMRISAYSALGKLLLSQVADDIRIAAILEGYIDCEDENQINRAIASFRRDDRKIQNEHTKLVAEIKRLNEELEKYDDANEQLRKHIKEYMERHK
jgi:septal ring factor EnvC (AmiA/AmiB activator)